MKKHILFLLCLIAVASTRAQVFADHFADKTLRVDYIFNGNASGASYLSERVIRSPHLGRKKASSGGTPVARQRADYYAQCSQRKDYLYYLFSPHSSRNGWKRTKPGM